MNGVPSLKSGDVKYLRKQSAENDALLAAFGINLDDLPSSLQAELDEAVDAKRTYALTDISPSILSEFYLTQSGDMVSKRAALAELKLRYSDCLDEQELIRHKINDANKFIVTVQNELQRAACEVDGLSVLEAKKLACQEAKTLKDKKDKMQENVKAEAIAELLKKVSNMENGDLYSKTSIKESNPSR